MLDAALSGDDARVDALVAGRPELRTDLACALVLAEPNALDQIGSANVNADLGPHAWPPLLYLCNSRYRAGEETTGNARVRICRALVELGANPNAGLRERESIRGYRTSLGAAVGRARSPALAEALLEAGADIADGPTLYEGSAMWEAVRQRDRHSLRILLAASPPQWHNCHALPHCLQLNDLDTVRLLLDHDADPNWTMGTWGFKGNCLHEAVVLGNDLPILEALLQHGADVAFRDRGGRTPLAVAVCLAREAHAALLREHGATDAEVRDVDRWIAACFARDTHRPPDRDTHPSPRPPDRDTHRPPDRDTHRPPDRDTHRPPDRDTHRSPGRDTHRDAVRKVGVPIVGEVGVPIVAIVGADVPIVGAIVGADPERARAVAVLADDETPMADRRCAREVIAEWLEPIDHVWLCRAVRNGNDEAVRLLLAGGADPDAVDDDGNRPIHLAISAGNAFAVELLLREGADTGAVNYAGESAFNVAEHSDLPARAEILALLAPHGPAKPTVYFDDDGFAATFEQAADAVVQGDIPALRNLLADDPVLASARSRRPHRCTLLHYLGANGIESERAKTPANAVEVIRVLLAAGADPNASCYTYRGGPDETTLGLLTSSSHPRDAGLTLSMVAALVDGGARSNEVYHLLTRLAGAPPDAVADFDPDSAVAGRALVECATLREQAMLFALLDAGVDIDARREDGATALHQAAIDGDTALVEALLKRGADLSLRDHVYEGTAAGWAYAGGHETLGKALQDRLAD